MQGDNNMTLSQFLKREELEKLRYWWPYIPRWKRRLARLYAQTVLTAILAGHKLFALMFPIYPAHWINGGYSHDRTDSDPSPTHAK